MPVPRFHPSPPTAFFLRAVGIHTRRAREAPNNNRSRPRPPRDRKLKYTVLPEFVPRPRNRYIWLRLLAGLELLDATTASAGPTLQSTRFARPPSSKWNNGAVELPHRTLARLS